MIGIDLSVEMIRSAQEKWHDGIDYRVGDAHMLNVEALRSETDGGFDFLVAGFLFNYANNPDQIRELTERALAVLKPGGSLIGLLPNPDQPIIPATDDARLKYGLSATMDTPVHDGARRKVTYWREDGTEIVTIEHTHWSRDTYTREMAEAGAEVEWRHCVPVPMTVREESSESWRGYEAAPQHDIVVLRATEGADEPANQPANQPANEGIDEPRRP
jgi:SAM-dependent methyltransferase